MSKIDQQLEALLQFIGDPSAMRYQTAVDEKCDQLRKYYLFWKCTAQKLGNLSDNGELGRWADAYNYAMLRYDRAYNRYQDKLNP